MCLDSRFIYNKYTHKRVLVDCGHCESCLQKKADARANRIRYNLKAGEICLFFTLTYTNEYVPYIDIRGLKKGINHNIPVFRDADVRICTSRFPFVRRYYKRVSRIHHIANIDNMILKHKDFISFHHLTGRSRHMVGVCVYKDVQNFFKRLRISLKRQYNYGKKFTYFACSEYGSTTNRPHFHCLLFIPAKDEEIFRSLIVEAWPYADSRRTSAFIEIARDCASYVSSYVNCASCIPEVLQTSDLRQRHSYSKGFGLGFDSFLLPQILEKVERGDMSFHRSAKVSGVIQPVILPIPKYVINRFFPKFKGYSRIDDDKVDFLLRSSSFTLHYAFKYSGEKYQWLRDLEYTSEELRQLRISIDNAYNRYHSATGRNFADYCIDFIRVWRCHLHTCNRLLHASVTNPLDYASFYEDFDCSLDSIYDYMCSLLPDAESIRKFVELHQDPHKVVNNYPHRVLTARRLSDKFRKYQKQKKVTDKVNTLMYMDFVY